MKKFLLIIMFCLVSIPVFADNNTIKATSTAKQSNKQETIGIDVIPMIKLDNSNPKVIQSNDVYVAPIISPSTTDSTVKVDLGNLKNFKKAPLLPDDNARIATQNYARYYNASYSKVFATLMGILDKSEFAIASYDTSSGKFFCNYQAKKPVYVTVTEYNSSSVLVKISPADGIYDISPSVISSIFEELNNSIQEK